ncbi:hypothetical protein [Archangium violaceum]|uniref:Uncharacterized protein n=1 Tax=Archangium violaceum Cb vi76 TaxID=1406225 RepID=A0A084SE00_9BACT|nr:hypothetical protein [Archangium violaceum]KFA86685.1 hypothetical protein Q664_52675 [Archangium violaceum Cb vi76]
MARTLQQLCQLMGGHNTDELNPGRCGKCGAQVSRMRLPPVSEPTSELPPLPVSVTFAPLEQLERGLAQLRCSRSGGHVPSLRDPATCCICGASLEVAHG